MHVNRSLTIVLVLLVAVSLTVAPVLAQEGETGEAEESEGGIEGAIEGFIEAQGTVGAVLILLGGIALLMVSTEKLISYLARASLNMKMSLFALAIIFTGFEFDDTILALVLSSGELEGAALGMALGTGLAITGITLAGAAIVRPFPVDLPTDYLVIFVLSPFVLVPFVLLGTLTFIHGVILTGFFVFSFAYFILRERQRDVPVFRNTEFGEEIRDLRPDGGTARPNSLEEIPEDRFFGNLTDSGIVWLGLSVIALAGIVFAAMLLEGGSEVVIEGFGIDQTVFGATFLTLILTFEDIMLTIEPIRRGFPEIGVGNVIGSVLFSVTGNVGVIMFLSEVSIESSVLTLHLPAVIIVTALAAYFLYEGYLKRWHGVLLGGLYIAYWLIAIFVFGGVPISG
ncbi:sodium:calcium antiporter [Natrinema salinisoli]|uniref:sodium:calcium antiporter n=1 Tax=Natrinema salinisoli TaxID=2878535 RepID=UPI001CF00A1F|nr:sodium:proton exchanger [Natrinema salinisoli]